MKTGTRINIENFVNALTIYDRYKILKKQSNELDDKSINDWRSRKNLVTDATFEEMLQYNNYEKSVFSNCINKRKIDEEVFLKAVLDSSWFNVYSTAIENYDFSAPTYSDDMDFKYILKPFLQYFESSLYDYLKEHNCNNLLEQTIPELKESLATQLLEISIKTFTLELNISRLRGELRGDTSEERFKSFIKLFSNPNKLVDFYDEYVFMTRLLCVRTTWFLESIKELVERIITNKDIIYNFFQLDSKEIIKSLQPGEGDTHQQGRTVMRITFNSGKRVVYKPKDLSVAKSYSEFIDWINSKGKLLSMPTYSILNFDSYVFEEYIVGASAEKESEIHNYYKRFGQIVSIMHILRGTDFHMENIIASGEFPYLVDLETIVQHSIAYNIGETAPILARKSLAESVSKTAFLPDNNFKIDFNQNQGIDLSGLNGQEQKLPHKVSGVVNTNTDEMKFDMVEVTLPGSSNIPYLNNKPVNYKNYIQDIKSGFEDACKFFIEYKEELLSKGILDTFKNSRTRVILRNTAQYGTILNSCYHPDYLRDAIEFEQVLENIWSVLFENKQPVRSEYKDLLNGDIPIFFVYNNSKDLIDSYGGSYINYFETSGYDKMIQHLVNFNEAEMDKQLSIMSVLLGEYKDNIHKESKFTTSPLRNILDSEKVETSITEKLLEEAKILGDSLLDHAFLSEDKQSISWLTVNPKNDSEINIISGDFYNGLSGVLLFFHYLGKETSDTKYKEITKIIINSAQKMLEVSDDSSCFSGKTSLLYPLYILMKDTNEVYYKEMFQKVINTLDKELETLPIDWIGGNTSALQIIINLFEHTKDPQYMMLALKLGDAIVTNLNNNNSLLGGFGHGASSIALVLLRLGETFGIKKYIDKGKEVLEYDRSLASSNGWLDIRDGGEKTLKHNWCHGTEGIGLSRILLRGYYEDDLINTEIKKSIEIVKQNNLKTNDGLCHGNLGTTELFLTYYEKTGDELYLHYAQKIAIEIISHKKGNNDYNVNSIKGFPNLSLFNGLAGVGYQLLRVRSNSTVPSILTLT